MDNEYQLDIKRFLEIYEKVKSQVPNNASKEYCEGRKMGIEVIKNEIINELNKKHINYYFHNKCLLNCIINEGYVVSFVCCNNDSIRKNQKLITELFPNTPNIYGVDIEFQNFGTIKFNNGSRIEFLNNNYSEQFVGKKFDCVIVDEIKEVNDRLHSTLKLPEIKYIKGCL